LEEESGDEIKNVFGEDPIEKLKQWKIRKNIPTGNTKTV
jgi:hypothetical protein